MPTNTHQTRKPVVSYPFGAILFPILGMLSDHHAELYWKEVLLASIGVLGVLTIAWLTLYLPLRDANKRGLILFLGAIAFWTAAPLLDWIRSAAGIDKMLSPLTILFAAALFLIVTATGIRLLHRSAKSFHTTTRVLNVIMASIIAVSLLTTTYNVLTTTPFEPDIPPTTNATQPNPDTPDIIILIADMYARHDTIQQYFDYDNTPFLKALEERGFYVARDANANYNFTRSAVPSVLNYQYLDGIAPVHGGNVEYSDLITNNRMTAYLKQRGYEFVAYATGTGLSEIHSADRYLAPPENISEFGNHLISRTPVRFILNRIRAYKQDTLDSRYYQYDQHRNRILFTFDGLKHFQRSNRPQFVFAHVLLPHDPFVFDANLNPVYPETRYVLAAYPKWENPNPDEYYEGYRNHIQAFNTLTLDAIDAIQKNAPDTVIIIQGDHGSRLNKLKEYNGKGWEAYVQEEMGILNAYYLPEIDYEKVLYPSISPVNSFRVVLNEYFGENLELLEDRSYFVEWWKDQVHDVTDRLSGAAATPESP